MFLILEWCISVKGGLSAVWIDSLIVSHLAQPVGVSTAFITLCLVISVPCIIHILEVLSLLPNIFQKCHCTVDAFRKMTNDESDSIRASGLIE